MTYALTRLDSRLREAESGCSSVDPAQLVSEIQSTIQSLSIFEEMDNAVLVDSLKGRCSTLSSKAPSLKPKPLIGSPQSEKLPETIEDKTGEVEPPKGPSFASQTVDLLYTTGGYALAVPKFALWTAPTSILSGAYSFLTYPFSKSTEESNSVEKTDVQSGIEVKPIVSTQISSSRAPVGLANGSNHCFVNAMRQFVYNTPLGEHLIGNLSQELFPVTKQDFENYQTQKSGTVMGGMKAVRAEVFPPELQVGTHDAQEALMHLFKFIEPTRFQKGKGILPQSMLRGTKNPLFNWVERTSTYDLDSLPKDFRYDRFSASSKGDLQLDGSHPSHATNTNFMIDGPLSLPLEGSMQEAWDNYCNPHIQRHKSDYGAYLPDSVKLSDLPRGDRFTVSEKGQIKALPDKIGEYTRFREPPEHLIFNFNRFQYNEHLRTSSKRSDRVDVQETFSLNQRHIKNGTADYQIKSFILHSGGTGGGHYRAYVKVENQWYHCNDSGVAPVSQAEAERRMGDAYIFYAQRTTHSISTSSAMHRPKLALNKERTPEKVSVPQTTKPRFTFQPYFGAPSKTRAPIGSSLRTTPFKGTTVLGSINQTDSAKAKSGSSYSCSAQSLGFLAKALNVETVNHEGLEPLLLDSQKKFDVLLEEQDTTLGKTQALHAEWAQQRVLNYVIENVESLYLNYHAFQAGKADLDDLTKYKTNICNDIVSKYKKDFFPGSGKPIFENAFGRFVDQRIDGSLTKTQFAEAIRTLISQDKALDKEAIKQSEKDTRRFYSGESRTITDVYSAFQNSFAGKSSPTPETFRLDADIDMRAGRFRKVLSDLTESSPRTPVGAAITCNDYTFALALVPQPDGKVMYQIFDSHGSTKLNSGNRNAFIYETTDEYDAARFLTKLIPYQAVDKRFEQYQLPDQNLFGYYTLRGAPSSNRIGNFFSALSGTFTGLFSRTSSSTSIKSPTVETLDRSSREEFGTELAAIGTELSLFENKHKKYNQVALNLLGSKLSRLQTQLPSDLQINCEHLSKRIAKLSVKATSVKTPTTTQTQEDPKNLIPFFQGKGKNLHGFSLDEILRFNDKEMEAHHNFIQWIFPTKQKSGSNASAPILNEGLIKAMRADPLVQKNLVLSFEKMLDYYGLKLEGSKVVKASNFSSRKKYWTINGGHNLLRMTRIINSMATLGQRELAKSYYDCIADIATKKEVSSLGSSPGIWENCMQSHALHIM